MDVPPTRKLTMPLDWMLVTPEALRALELEKLLQPVEARRCFDYTQKLATLRNQTDLWPPAEAACVEFAVQATGMRLCHDQPSEPFGPMFQMGDGRSAIPADSPKVTALTSEAQTQSRPRRPVLQVIEGGRD